MSARSSVGFFGKLPCNGDFLERRVPQAFLEVWDPWLQLCVHTSRQVLQESWLPSYLTSPLWRFVLSEAVCGSGAYAGVLAPSVDRVGRYFPLTVVTQIDVAACPLQFATQHTSWFDGLESLIITALEDSNLSLEWFDTQVEGFARQLDDDPDGGDRLLVGMFEGSRFPAQGVAWRAPLRAAGQLHRAINAFAFSQLSAQLRPLGVWYTEGSQGAAPSWLSLRGLPTPEQFGAMLDGQWARDGWSSLGELRGEPESIAQPPAANGTPDTASAPASVLGPPRVTLPDVQLSAIETNKAAFIVRPEIGLWAVAATGADENPEAVRMIADAMQQLVPAPSLTLLVEAVRQLMSDVQRRLRHLATRDVQRVESHASMAAMLAAGAECALLTAGRVQKLRIRERMVETFADPDDAGHGASAAPGSLMDLLSSDPRSAAGIGTGYFTDLQVHYDRLQREDLWLLCAQAAISPKNLEYVMGAAASGLPISARVVADMIGKDASIGAVVPLLTLEM
jgi:type VI secretion system protein ImpM